MYDWLKSETAPKILVESVKLLDTAEIVGSKHSPVIMGWAKELGLQKDYIADEIPWCGLAMAIIVKRAGYEVAAAPLWALSWGKFGKKADEPMLGDILTFKRPGGGHVGIYVGEDADCYHVLGGNQGNKHCVKRLEKFRLVAARRPVFKIAQPVQVRKIHLSAQGSVSANEI
jgi:uncharacterized protein (TIGR02594 family)